METPLEPLPDWLEPALEALGAAFGHRMVMTVVPGEPGTGRGLRVFAGFEGPPRVGGPQFLLVQGQRITAESLRQIPMSRLERMYLNETGAETALDDLPKLERAGRSPEAFSKLVAQHYLAWRQRDPHPAKAMSDAYGIKQATVHSWVREARLRGDLSRAERRTAHREPADGAVPLPHLESGPAADLDARDE